MTTERPSIIVISIDALRGDCTPFAEESPHLRSLGLRPPTLPAFSGMVQRSAVFTQAIACSSYTTACHASFFTGLAPPEHGVRAFSVTSLSNGVRTLAEILVQAGYATCAMSDKPLFFQPYGLLRGFQAVVANDEEALAWWDSYGGMPRLLFMHLWDVHHPYGMPYGRAYRAAYPAIVAGWKERLRSRGISLPAPVASDEEDPDRSAVAQMQIAWHNERGFKAALVDYNEGVETFDRGRLASLAAALRARSIDSNALMVITADHGEGRDFPPSQLAKHGTTLKDDQVHIPLFIQMPGMATTRIASQASQADIAPTVLDALGLLGERTAPRSACSGRSLLPLLRGEALPERAAYAETSTVFKDPTLPMTDPAAHRSPMVRYRILRYPDRKYWLVGKPVVWSESLLASPPDEFVRILFNDVLGRRAGGDEEAQWQAQAQAVLPGDLAKRRAIAQRFEQMGEFKHLPKYAIFDLTRDPLEVKPIAAQAKPADWAVYQQQLEILQEIERAARPGEPLVSNEADEEVILKRLQDLGYVE